MHEVADMHRLLKCSTHAAMAAHCGKSKCSDSRYIVSKDRAVPSSTECE
jgi:hypothetical protein